MRILLSNDDGVHAPGLAALYQELSKLGKVWVSAPLHEKSTTGHSLTLHKPLRITKTPAGFYGVSGSPADCVNMGVREIMPSKPDLVVSGINRGANLGQDIYYSGTVSAAREAVILGIPAIAVSLAVDFDSPRADHKLNFAAAAKVCAQLIRDIADHDIPAHTLLNLNVPDRPLSRVKGVRLSRQGFRHYSGAIVKRKDHRGRPYYWVGGAYEGYRKDEETDCHAVELGYASLTPLRLDTTDVACLAMLAGYAPDSPKSSKLKGGRR